ncbi:MAG: pilin [Methylococcales bacterium]
MKRSNAGFTLIELMIVIAILGILIAIAMPAYQDYTVRAKMSEALSLAAKDKLATAEYYMSNSAFPNTLEEAGSTTVANASKYVGQIHMLSPGTICLHVQNTGEPSVDSGFHPLRLQATVNGTGAIEWVCGHGAGSNDKFYPANCRNIL